MHLLYAFAEITNPNIALTAQCVTDTLSAGASESIFTANSTAAIMIVINVRLSLFIAANRTAFYAINHQGRNAFPTECAMNFVMATTNARALRIIAIYWANDLR